MLSVAILGAGEMGLIHAEAYRSIVNTQVVTVYGRRPDSADAIARTVEARATTGLRDILADERVDAVDICLPSRIHREYAVSSLGAGKHVFCETPMALSYDDAQAMRDAASTSGRLLLVGLLMRFVNEYRYVKQALDSGELGVPVAASAYRLGSYLHPDNPHRKDHYSDPTTELMTFDFDVVNWLFGLPRTVYATSSDLPDGRPGHVCASLAYDNVAVQVEASGVMPPSFPLTIGLRVVAGRRALEVTTTFLSSPPDITLMSYPAHGAAAPVSVAATNPYEEECRYFVDFVAGRADPALVSADRAVEALRLSLATQSSLQRPAPVAVWPTEDRY